MVLMSMELFETMRKKWDVYSVIELSEAQIQRGTVKDVHKALADVRSKYGL